jgi:hypothetical protein
MVKQNHFFSCCNDDNDMLPINWLQESNHDKHPIVNHKYQKQKNTHKCKLKAYSNSVADSMLGTKSLNCGKNIAQ